jgi:hypothetical protein
VAAEPDLLFLLEHQDLSIPEAAAAVPVGLQHSKGQELLYLAEMAGLVLLY